MTNGDLVDVAWIAGALVLVASALVARRRQLGQGRLARWGVIWLSIFVAATLFALTLHNIYYRDL